MTWSSSSPPVGAADWSWSDFGPTPSEVAKERESEAERHALEVEQAYNRGLADGQARSVAAARAELASAVAMSIEALEQVRASRDAWKAQLQEDLVALAAAMARVVVDDVLEADPTIFAALAKKAVAALPADEAVRIRLHPDDLHRLTENECVNDVVGTRTVRWIPDEDLVVGGCIVEGPDRIVDARLDEALIRLVEKLRDA